MWHASGGNKYIPRFEEKPERTRLLGRPSVDGSIILKLILKKYDDTLWAGLIWVGIMTSGELL